MPERWDEIDRVWHALLERPEPERAAAIDELCGQDLTLHRDIESLLAHLARASAAGFGVAAVGVADARESLIGRQLGPYAVHTLLGAGGMGEVFQATDSTLDREVAFKILPDLWLADRDRQARFDREARLLASLNHPNIGSIYGVHESGSLRALILELVEGDTLAERLATRAGAPGVRRGMPIADVVTVATQIIDALEAAHARGIVHRDLKPANIKITPEMRVKVLDFGLALAVSGANGDSGRSSASATSKNVTLAGVLLGTPAYMSPEQARGRPFEETMGGFFENDEGGAPQLFFSSTRPGVGDFDIYVAELQPHGTFGEATLVEGLNSNRADLGLMVRFDGLEAFFFSTRPGVGATDMWTATRQTVFDAWSPPTNLGPLVNSMRVDQRPYIASDRRTLYFASGRDGGFGDNDLYVTTRSKNRD
jgi:serine/threonine protein kinase